MSKFPFHHEPYWTYDFCELTEYAQRIIGKIQPHFVSEDDITVGETTRIGTCEVRKLPDSSFGRVLPLLHLREAIGSTRTLGTPRIFILPKSGQEMEFEFLLPNRRSRWHDNGMNVVQVLSKSFVIYQEYIVGSGRVGDMSFVHYGHRDFNAKQVILSSHDGKKYLIDTKEQKNFFHPTISPFADDFLCEDRVGIFKALGVTSSNSYQKFANTSREEMLEAKESIYGVDKKSVRVVVSRE